MLSVCILQFDKPKQGKTIKLRIVFLEELRYSLAPSATRLKVLFCKSLSENKEVELSQDQR